MRLDVVYHLASCSTAPVDPFGNYSLVPCGRTAKFYVVLVPCPVGNSSCVDPPLDRSACGNSTPTMPLGGCVPALPTATPGRFTTPEIATSTKPGQHMLAAVYWGNGSDYWYGQLESAWRVQPELTTQPSLTPTFNPWGRGRVISLPSTQLKLRVSLDAFEDLRQPVWAYLPAACTEGLKGSAPPPACARAKVVVVTDGEWAASASVAAALTASADGLVAQLRTRPLVIVYAPSTLTFANGSSWECARGAMYTPSPWPNGPLQCAAAFGQSDAYLAHLAESLLPSVRRRYGIVDGKAAIAGFSLGGLTACYAAWSRPDAFDAAACGSPSFWYPVENFVGPGDFNRTFFARLLLSKPPPANARLFASDGTGEFMDMGGTRREPGSIPMMVAAMRRLGLTFSFEQNEGYEHDAERAWVTSTLWRGLEAVVPAELEPRGSSCPGKMNDL